MQKLLLQRSVSTPCYIYDASKVKQNLEFLFKTFSPCKAKIFFAVKANTNLNILKIIKNLGAGAEVSSQGELFISFKAGFEPDKILFNNIAKKEEEIIYAIKKGVKYFNFESFDQGILLEKCARRLKKKIFSFIRINPEIFPDTHPHLSTGSSSSKFGITFDELNKFISEMKKFKFAILKGIHSHIGSQILKPEPFIDASKKIEEFILFFKKHGIKIEFVNFGGGFGVPYHPEEENLNLKPIAEEYRRIHKKYNVKIFIEPGRFIVANAGIILTKVISIKERNGIPLYIIDAGMTENPRPALYGAYHHIEPLKNKRGRKIKSRIAGPLCENSDEFGIYKLPKLKIGDLLLIYNCGAYTRTMASNYNGRPLAPEYLIDGKLKIIRKKQKIESLIENEKY